MKHVSLRGAQRRLSRGNPRGSNPRLPLGNWFLSSKGRLPRFARNDRGNGLAPSHLSLRGAQRRSNPRLPLGNRFLSSKGRLPRFARNDSGKGLARNDRGNGPAPSHLSLRGAQRRSNPRLPLGKRFLWSRGRLLRFARNDSGKGLARKDSGEGLARSDSGKGLARHGIFGLLLVAIVAILGLSLCSRPALAQDGPADLRIQQVRIQVMPEFDDPRVLVIVQGRMAAAENPAAAENQFPMPVTFRLPLDAEINQMATIETLGGGTSAEAFDTRPDPDDGRWLLATYNLRDAHFFYEYYYDPLPADENKDFTFVASSLYPIDELTIEVQEPSAATGLSLEPAAASSRLDPTLNLRYHQIHAGALPAGGETAVRVRYTKTDPAPSLAWEDVMAAQAARTGAGAPAPQATAAENRFPAGILAGLGLGALAGAIVIGWVRARPGSPASGGNVAPAGYCPDCGTALKWEASYCHVCGSVVGLASGRPTHVL
jgi:hypothetical protein